MLAFGTPALAADLPDLPVKAPPVPYVADYDWNGWYVGAHLAVIGGRSNWSATPPGAPGLAGSFNLPFNFDFMAGTGSLRHRPAGRLQPCFRSRVLLGVEADCHRAQLGRAVPYSVQGSQTVTTPAAGQVTYNEAVIDYGSLRGRVGYAFDHFLLYGTGGFAWSYDQLTRTHVASPAVGGRRGRDCRYAPVVAVGLGRRSRPGNSVTDKWTATAEYLWTGFAEPRRRPSRRQPRLPIQPRDGSIRVGLNYQLDVDNADPELLTNGARRSRPTASPSTARQRTPNQYYPALPRAL